MQEALGLKVSQFVQLMGDRQTSARGELHAAAGGARSNMRRLVERLQEGGE